MNQQKNHRTISEIGGWIDAFILDRKAGNLSDGTLYFYTYKLNKFKMYCDAASIFTPESIGAEDLRQELGGELALHIREGKGAKERLIPYGELDWCLAIVDRWLAAAGIHSGAVFRGFYRGGKTLRRGRLSVRAIEYILNDYPITKNGNVVQVKPHDCRRTYARRLYEAGADLVAIQQNLGHADIKTTLGYIGELDASKRRAPAVYSYDLRRLNGAFRHLSSDLVIS